MQANFALQTSERLAQSELLSQPHQLPRQIGASPPQTPPSEQLQTPCSQGKPGGQFESSTQKPHTPSSHPRFE
jgi:hypothetical protein